MPWSEKKSRGGYTRGRGARGYRGGHSEGGSNRGRPYKRPSDYNSHNVKRPRYKVGERLKEEDVGVTQFVGDHKRFGGIIKERFSDFHVHEISCDGQICKLTNHDIPPEPQDLQDTSKLKESISQDIAEKIEAFSAEKEESTLEIDVTEIDKELRRNIHTLAKKIPNVVSETIDREDKKFIVLAKKKHKNSRYAFRDDRRVDWSGREGNYCHFLLHKFNMDTMDALNQLAVRLRLKSDAFGYAGTKDRRARTTQWISLKKVSPANIHSAAKQVRGAHVGNFKFSKEPLKLGMLEGNHFKMALRNVSGTDEEIEKAMTSLRDNGFINYYGLQRFGTIAAIPTHEIGKALLQGKWEKAIDLILKPRDGEENSDIGEARKVYEETKSAKLGLKLIARSGKIEAKLLEGIANGNETNPQGALDHIPRNTRLMYIHSYQSFIWNKVVSRRIAEFGPKPIVGDLVYEKLESEDNKMEIPEEDEKKCDEEEADDSQTEIPIENIQISKDEKSEGETESPTVDGPNDVLDDPKGQASLRPVRALTEEELSQYTLADVVMPKPGWKVTYPAYAKPWFDEFLAEDDLTTDLRQNNKKYSLGGGYRQILETPGDLHWKIVRHNGYHEDLIRCDIDDMRGLEPLKDDPEGKYRALILEFSLKSSTYATMAVREILEHSTSVDTQVAQSAANRAESGIDNPTEDSVKSEDKAEVAETSEMDCDPIQVSVDSSEAIEKKDISETGNETIQAEISTDKNIPKELENTVDNATEKDSKTQEKDISETENETMEAEISTDKNIPKELENTVDNATEKDSKNHEKDISETENGTIQAEISKDKNIPKELENTVDNPTQKDSKTQEKDIPETENGTIETEISTDKNIPKELENTVDNATEKDPKTHEKEETVKDIEGSH